MADVLHRNLTGADLHECKGAATASSGQVPVATGAGTAVFANLPYSAISGAPITPQVYFNGTVVSTSPKINHYIITATSGNWSQGITGISTLHGIQATAVGGSTYPTAAIATVASATSTTITGNVIVNGAIASGTNTVYLTVFGV